MQTNKTAIIIGGGVIGCGIALQLLRRGYQTFNVDRNAEVGFGSTVNSCAIVRFSYSTLDSVKLALEGHHYWKNWPAVLGVEDPRGYARFVQTGHLVLKTFPTDRAEMLDLYRKAGVPFEEWTVEQLRERLPIYSTDSFFPPKPVDDPDFQQPPERQLAGAIFCPDGGYVNDPQLATHNLRCAIEAAGGQFLMKREVVAILRRNGRVSGIGLADGSELQADVVVNAAGPHSVIINRMAGVEQTMKVSTRALRREVHHLASPPEFDFGARGICTSDPDLGIYWRPETGNKLGVGSGDPPCDPKTWIDDPRKFDRDIREQQWQTQVFRLAQRVPELRIPNQAQGVVDLYDVSSDWIPIYDKSDLPGFYMAIGSSGHQFKNAGVAGALMAELIDYQESGGDHDAQPFQFKGRFTGLVINTGAYSRRRDPNKASSFSVRG